MNAFVPYLAALHQQDLLQQAELRRRAKRGTASHAGVPAWRRFVGGGARSLSGLFASAARTLDPSVGTSRSFDRSGDSAGRALAG